MFDTLLIANRGEIAVRIARTAREMGIRVVAVYSQADRDALHVAVADEAVAIGPAPASQSYLDSSRLIAAACETGAQAIHPGYGFLSENADFAEACARAGLVFIGPPVEAIRVMGSKARSKALMAEAGVPLAPGYQGEDQSLSTLRGEAERIGFPVLLKASAGGGGKGMRRVDSVVEFEAALASAQREARAAFGDDRMLVEKLIDSPRHVEVQVFGDRHGGLVHLFERDCTVQRRHQKVIEEAPAPDLPDVVRARLHEAALNAARAVEYVGAGTVEFLYDGDENVYFMEMNTRLQVEHPVTEAVTGQDLVAWQIRVAAGEALPLTQSQIACTGHAMEARLYAERPEAGFLPSTGRVAHLALPAPGNGLRLDLGLAEGDEVSSHYDPMLGKLIAHGSDRERARRRLARLVAGVRVAGPETNAAFLHRVLTHPAFAAGKLDTGFIERHGGGLLEAPPCPPGAEAAALLWLLATRQAFADGDPWTCLDGFRVNGPAVAAMEIKGGDETRRIRLERDREGLRLLASDGSVHDLHDAEVDGPEVRFRLEGGPVDAHVAADGKGGLRVWIGGETWRLEPWRPSAESRGQTRLASALSSPMPGTVIAFPVDAGAQVAAGDTLAVVEAMKMEHPILAPSAGRITALRFAVGDQVQQGDQLVSFEPQGEPEREPQAEPEGEAKG